MVPDVLGRLLAALRSPPPRRPPPQALAARHRAVLLLGFGAALRHSEIVALTTRRYSRRRPRLCLCWLAFVAAPSRSGQITVSRISVRSLAFEAWMEFRRGGAGSVAPAANPPPLPGVSRTGP